MAPEPSPRFAAAARAPAPSAARTRLAAPALFATLVGLAAALAPPLAGASVRIMDYNLLGWSGTGGLSRVAYMQAVTRNAAPDLMVDEEVLDQAGVDLFKNSVLRSWADDWEAAPFNNGPDTDNALFYRTSKWTFLDKVQIATDLRDASRFHMRLVGYAASEAEVYLYVFHLKASEGSTNEAQRLAEMRIIRGDAETLPVGSHVLFCGDYNVYTYLETPFQYALSSIGDNVGRMKDPVNNLRPWHDDYPTSALWWTQSPRTLSFGGGATGGMDDRFDFILESYNLDDGLGLDLDPATYKSWGNDGQHWNVAINAAPTNAAIGQALADSLMNASDHLPVIVDLILPSVLGLSADHLAFGPVIQGAAAHLPIVVSNPAVPPARALEVSYETTDGFTADVPPSPIAPGGSATTHVALDTSAPGEHAGQFNVFSNAPDAPFVSLPLTGTVLAHGVPSADSAQVVAEGALDFGTHGPGGFADLAAKVWNPGYGPLQAKVHVHGATIQGADAARFSLVEPFADALVGDSPARYDVRFDDTGLSADGDFAATLVLQTEDDPSVQGASALPGVGYQLSAHFHNDLTDVGDGGLPVRTRLYAPSPNPSRAAGTALRFDLARPGHVTLALYDVRGRLVATLADGARPAGRHAQAWDGRDTAGRLAANGLYFVRLVTGQGTFGERFLVLR